MKTVGILEPTRVKIKEELLFDSVLQPLSDFWH